METLATTPTTNPLQKQNTSGGCSKSSGDTAAVSAAMAEKSSSSSSCSKSSPSSAAAATLGATETTIGDRVGANTTVVYDVEHLATFSTTGSHETTNNNRSQTAATKSNNGSGGKTNNTPGAATAATTNGSEPNKATTTVATSGASTTTPKVALQRLFELEKLSGIWTQHMQIELSDDFMLIVDCETNSVVERFNRDCVTKPEAFSHYNDIYNNIVVFIIKQQNNDSKSRQDRDEPESSDENSSENERDNGNEESERNPSAGGELHIFQCVSHRAQQLVSDILDWKLKPSADTERQARTRDDTHVRDQREEAESSEMQDHRIASSTSAQKQHNKLVKSASSPPLATDTNGASTSPNGGKPMVTVASSSSVNEQVPIVNVNVKETVQVFNQIAALREKSKPTSPTNNGARPLSDASLTSGSHCAPPPPLPPVSSTSTGATSEQQQQATRAAGGGTSLISPNGDASGQQFYKQRSIRATLAPKFAPGSPQASKQAGGGEQPQAATTKSNHSKLDQLIVPGSSNSTADSASSSTASSSFNQGPSHGGSSGSGSSGHQATKSQQRLGSPDVVQNHHHHSATSDKPASSSSSSSKPSGHSQHHHHHHHQQHHSNNQASSAAHKSHSKQHRTSSDSSRSHGSSSTGHSQLEQVSSNESYVSVLNHCFDDIEKFIIRLQQAVAAIHELQTKSKLSKRAAGGQHHQVNGGLKGNANLASAPITAAELAALSARARGPSEDDYFDILSKFKLAFNLLAKLKGCIHEPNAPELVHFLFTPLAIIIESARNANPPIDPTLVGIPYLNQDALDLLSNCCTSKESDMWISLGPNWTQTIDVNLLKASRLPSSFQPIFSDGWEPIIGELELIGLVVNPASSASAATTPAATLGNLPPELDMPDADNLDISRDHMANGGRYLHHPSATSESSRRGYLLDESKQQHYQHYQQSSGKMADISRDMMNPASKQHMSRDLSKKRTVGGGGGSSRRSDSVEPAPGGYHHHPQSHSQHLHQRGGFDSHGNPLPYDSYLNASNPSLAETSGFSRMSAVSAEHLASRSGRYQQQQSSRQLSRHNKHQPGPSSRQYPEYSYDQLGAYPAPMGPFRGLDDPADGAGSHPLQQQHHSDDYSELLEDTEDLNEFDHHLMSSGRNHAAGMAARQHHKQAGSGDRSQYGRAQMLGKQSASTRHGSHGKLVGRHQHQQYPDEQQLVDPYLAQISASDHEAMLMDLGPVQTEWFYELQARGALIVRVLFTRDANNDKELSVRRGEILEILDDTRKWWRARNIELQVAHVPHTIVAVMQGYQTLDELLANNPGSMGEEQPSSLMTSGSSQQQQRSMARSRGFEPQPLVAAAGGLGSNNHHVQQHQHLQYYHGGSRDNKRSSSSKTAGAFRYF